MADLEFYMKRSLCDCEERIKVFFSFEEVIADAERAYWDIFYENDDFYRNRVFKDLNSINEQFCGLFRYDRALFSHCANYWVEFDDGGIRSSYKFTDESMLLDLLERLNIRTPDFVADRLLAKLGE